MNRSGKFEQGGQSRDTLKYLSISNTPHLHRGVTLRIMVETSWRVESFNNLDIGIKHRVLH